jgi:hypothetical protein
VVTLANEPRKRLTTLTWTTVDPDGSLFARGRHDYYTIIVRESSKEHPKDYIVELYVTDREMTILEIKVNADSEKLELLSRSIVSRNSSSRASTDQVVGEMKDTAEKREKENPYSSISTDYRVK